MELAAGLWSTIVGKESSPEDSTSLSLDSISMDMDSQSPEEIKRDLREFKKKCAAQKGVITKLTKAYDTLWSHALENR